MPDIGYAGATLKLPDGAPPEAVKKAIAHFQTTPEFDKLIDKKSGAPARVRAAVGGSAYQDRLANLQRFYPDAIPYGDDNFVFSDPSTGRPTLHNPEGLDVGDVASFAKVGVQAVGSSLGATAGFLAGGPVGAVIGAGAGNAASAALYDTTQAAFGQIDTRSAPIRVLDTAVEFGAGAIGQKVGDLAEQGVKRLLGGGTDAARTLVNKFMAVKVRPTAPAITGNKFLGSLDDGLSTSLGGAKIMQDQAQEVLKQVAAAADDIASKYGQSLTPQGAGGVIKEAAKAAGKRFEDTQGALYDEAFNAIGKETPVQLSAAGRLFLQMKAELARAPKSLSGKLIPPMKQLSGLLEDAQQGGIPFEALRQVRTTIGKEIDTPNLVGGAATRQTGLQRIYGALTLDLSAAAKKAGAGAKLDKADTVTREFMNGAGKLLNKIDSLDADERAYSFAIEGMQKGATRLAALRKQFTDDEWSTVSSTVLARLGRAVPSAQDAAGETFSVATFLTNWNKISPEAKTALFDGGRFSGLKPALDNLVEVASALKDVGKLRNSSNTAHTLISYSALNVLGAALGGLATGDVSGGVGGLATTIVAPRVAAKLLTNPKFVAWLGTPISKASGITEHLGRLISIADTEPRIKEEVQLFLTALRDVPQPDQQDEAQ